MSTQEDRARWIPVTERLPEGDDTVLVYCPEVFKYVTGPHKSFFGRYSHTLDKWIVLSFGANDTWTVTHWMPLPEPPAQESQED